MENKIKKIALNLFIFVFYVVFGFVMIFFSLWLTSIFISQPIGKGNENYFNIATLVIVSISFFGQGFIREGYPLVRVSLVVVFIITIFCFAKALYVRGLFSFS